MYIRTFLLMLACIVCGTQPMSAQHLMINEVMQSNIDYLMVDKDFPDSWVELYNPTQSDIDLSRYTLSEHSDGHNGYQFPARTARVPAGGHLVIYCDKEGSGLHASFRIDSGKAGVYLFDPSGSLVDGLELDKMPAPNIAYGRVHDGADDWQYEVTPTAGSANDSEGSTMLLPAPEFSVPGGVYTEPFSLTLSIPDVADLPADTRLYVTVDGSEPTQESRPITHSQTLMVSRTMVIRARLISAHALSPVSTTHSYIFHPRTTTLPIVSIVTNHDYIYGNQLGITSAAVNDGRPNYMQSWRRPINIEYFDMRQGGITCFNQLAETAVSGVSTREQPQKSFKVYANKRFGKKNYKGDFWPDKPEVNKVKSFVLRSGGNNSFTTRINDALVQRLFGTHVPNLDWQAYQPVIVYINGNYAGEFGMRERSNEDFVQANYDLEDIETADEQSYQSPARGSQFADFHRAYHSPTTTYEMMDTLMDIDNFAHSLLAEMYAMNTDFPTNNVAMWRDNAPGGRWRWILKDLDRAGMNIALYPSSFDMFRYLFTPDDIMYAGMYHFDLYSRMMQYPQFRERYIDLMSVSLGDFLRPGIINAMADSMVNDIYDELRYTFQAYNCTREWTAFQQNLSNLQQFFQSRPSYLYSQMSDYLQLGESVPLIIDPVDADTTTINQVPLYTRQFQGRWYMGRPLTLHTSNPRCGWQLTVTSRTNAPVQYTFDTPTIHINPSDYVIASTDTIHFEPYLMEQGEVDPDEPGEEPGEEVDPDEPGEEPGEGEVDPDEPGEEPGEGEVDPDDPGEEPGEGEVDPDDPGEEPGEGEVDPDEPGEEPGEEDTAVSTPVSVLRYTIYGPDGQRRLRLARGLNILRSPDGQVRKVIVD